MSGGSGCKTMPPILRGHTPTPMRTLSHRKLIQMAGWAAMLAFAQVTRGTRRIKTCP